MIVYLEEEFINVCVDYFNEFLYKSTRKYALIEIDKKKYLLPFTSKQRKGTGYLLSFGYISYEKCFELVNEDIIKCDEINATFQSILKEQLMDIKITLELYLDNNSIIFDEEVMKTLQYDFRKVDYVEKRRSESENEFHCNEVNEQ